MIALAQETDAVLLAIRACAPHLVEVQLTPPLKTKARFGLVTIANKAEAIFLPELQRLMVAVMGEPADRGL
jgi:hypothetical protein